MSSTRRLPAKKRPIGSYSDDYSLSSSESSSASSASFQMEENSSDEEMGTEERNDKDELMDNSQESNFSVPSPLGLATQPLERPAKKRKISLSPQDSLAKRSRPNSPSSIVTVKESSYQQEGTVPLLCLDDPHPATPKSKLAEKLTSHVSSKPTGAFRVHAAISAASKSPPPKRPNIEKEKQASRVKPTMKNKKAETTRWQIENSEPCDSKSTLNRKPSPAKKASKLKMPPAEAMPKSKPTAVKANVITVIETLDSKAVAKEKVSSAGKKTANKMSVTGDAKNQSMADSKKTRKKKKTFQDQLLQHVFFSGKPHIVKDLTQHLKTSEASVNYCLLSLVDKNWIMKKKFTSKSRSRELYWANTDSKNKELMAALDIVPPQEVAEARVKLANLQQQEKSSMMELHKVMQEPSNVELNERVASAENEVRTLQAEVDAISKRIVTNKNPVAPKQKSGFARSKVSKARSNPKRIKVEINRMRDEWKKRKEKCVDFIECLADGMEKKVKDVIKLLELETDEVGVKMPPKYDIKK